MWRSVFLHEFLDDEIRNFQALPGHATPASLMLTPFPAPPLGINSVKLTQGQGFEYSLAEQLDEVIGVSGRIHLWHPYQGFLFKAPFIIRVGDMAELTLRPFDFRDFMPNSPDIWSLEEAPIFARLRIGSTQVELGSFRFPYQRFANLRFDWHTSGQARVLLDGRLVGYHNAVAPTAQLEVDNVTFGVSAEGTPPGTMTRYHVGGMFARVLRRSDSLAVFSRLLPVVDVPDDNLFNRCRVRAAMNLLAMVQQLRQFMTLVNQQLSQPWSQESGPAEGPFNPEATEAHQLATKAVAELGTMLRTGNFSTPEAFLSPFTAFLRILHDALPNEFEALAEDLTKTPVIPDACRQVFEAALEQGGQELRPLVRLLSVASERIREIAGGS